jgi:hypothetical protein
VGTGEFDLNHRDVKGNNVLYYTKKKDVISYLVEQGAEMAPEKQKVGGKGKETKYWKGGGGTEKTHHGGRKKHTAGEVKVFNLVSLWDELSEVETWQKFQEMFPKLAACWSEEQLIHHIENYLNIPDELVIYSNWESMAKKVLNSLWAKDGAFNFHMPVDPKMFNGAIDDYFDKVSNPMDLSTVKDKLNAHIYIKVRDFIKDVHLTFDNCVTYNGPNHPLSFTAQKLKDTFEELLTSHNIDYYNVIR